METSILNATKKNLGLGDNYTPFDEMIITHINSAFSSLNQIGVGPALGFSIEDDTAVWEDLGLPLNQLGMAKTFVFLKVKVLFDPPTTSFLLDSVNKQLEEHLERLSIFREELVPKPDLSGSTSDGEIEYVPMHSYMEGGYDA